MAFLRALPLGLVCLCALALPTANAVGVETDAPAPAAYRGLGTWIDVYSPSFRADPERVMTDLASRGVHAVFVETGSFRQRPDVVAPQQLRRIIEAAHRNRIAVVAWYLPGLADPERDLRRARAAIFLRTGDGDRFDSFGLDIESSAVRSSSERNRRLLRLSNQLRADVGPAYPLGAIIPSPVGMNRLPRYWPHFPYRRLAHIYDVFLPMDYYSYRARGAAQVTAYVQTSVAIIRQATGDETLPIHVIGGLAEATSHGDAVAFARAAASCGAYGLSLYDYDTTKQTLWPLLRSAARRSVPPVRPAPRTAG